MTSVAQSLTSELKEIRSVINNTILLIKNLHFNTFLAIWTSNSNNKDAVMEIGRKLKEGLNLPERLKIQYQTHSDSMVKNSSSVKSLYEI